jgi:F-type H+-transporting ATPase subunit b
MEHAAQPSIADLAWPVVNFTIFAIIVVRFLAGPIREYFRARTERLRDALTAGRRAREEAMALKAQVDRDLAGLPALRERLKAELRDAAEHERATLLANAQATAERIRSDARILADQEIAAARRAVRAETVEEAVRQATALVRAALDADDQERFVRDFVASARIAA